MYKHIEGKLIKKHMSTEHMYVTLYMHMLCIMSPQRCPTIHMYVHVHCIP